VREGTSNECKEGGGGSKCAGGFGRYKNGKVAVHLDLHDCCIRSVRHTTSSYIWDIYSSDSPRHQGHEDLAPHQLVPEQYGSGDNGSERTLRSD
jgi:hypothetical protein